MKYILAIFLLVQSLFLIAQEPFYKRQNEVVQTFVESFNTQDFSKLKRDFILAAKLFPIQNMLKKEYRSYYKEYGKINIDSINYQSANGLTTYLSFEDDTSQKEQLYIKFTDKMKVEGLGFKEPDFNYPKTFAFGSPRSIKARNAAIDSLMRKAHLTGNFNGCVLLVENGMDIYKNCFGYSDFSNRELLNDSSIFELASCSKQFTALAIMMLEEQGKLEYSDNIEKFIPGLPYAKITVENLLTHTSGLPDYMKLFEKHWDKQKIATNEDIVELLKAHKPKPYFLPNEVYSYSNTGYALLSVIIKKASGLSYPEFLQQNIFEPLNMKHTLVYNTRRSNGRRLNNYAYGYVYSEELDKYVLPDSLKEFQYVRYLDAITGDGVVNTSLNDLILWDQALRNGKLVNKATLEKAFSKHTLPDGKRIKYGYGVFLSGDSTSERVAWHTGGWPGYHTLILRFLDKDKMVVVLSNNEYPRFNRLADKLVKY